MLSWDEGDTTGRPWGDLRAAAKRRGRYLRRRRLVVRGSVAALVGCAALVAVLVELPSPKATKVVTAPPPILRLTGSVAALTENGNIDELAYPSGQVIRQIAPASEVLHCYATGPSCSAQQPTITQAQIAYDRQTDQLFVDLGGAQVESIPLHGGPASLVATDASTLSVSPDGTRLAYSTSGAQLAEATVTVRTLATGQRQSWTIPALPVATQAGLPYPNTTEDTGITGLAWSPDSTHLAVNMYLSYGLNAANSLGTTFGEITMLDTATGVTVANPRFIGPLATSMANLRAPSDGKGWDQGTSVGSSGQILALHAGLQNGGFYDTGMGADPIDLSIINATDGGSSDVRLAQPPLSASEATLSPGLVRSGSATLYGVDPSGRYALLLGSGPPRLEGWNIDQHAAAVTVIANRVAAATWIVSPG